MKLSAGSEIARIKVTQYLLRLRDEDDKSKFLALAGGCDWKCRLVF